MPCIYLFIFLSISAVISDCRTSSILSVIKSGDQELFFGGKSVQVERNTRVKARVKAHALKELIEGKERVVVMGHSISDVDAFGASVGIYRIARTLNSAWRWWSITTTVCAISIRAGHSV